MSMAPQRHCPDCEEIHAINSVLAVSRTKLAKNERLGLPTEGMERYIKSQEAEKEKLERKHAVYFPEIEEMKEALS